MKDAHVGPLLAIFRELDSDTQGRIEAHLTVCEECRVLHDAYTRQDRLLSQMPAAPASPRMLAAIRQRAAAPARRFSARRVPRFGFIAVLLAILFAFNVGVVAVSAQALPGDFFYPVKRALERAALAVLSATEARSAYEDTLAERRLFEARRVLELQRRASSVEFAGSLDRLEGGWVVAGIPLDLEQSQVDAVGIEAGDVVRVEGEVSGGHMRVLSIQRERKDEANALPTTPTASATPTPSLTVTWPLTPSEEAGRDPGRPQESTATETPTDVGIATPTPTAEAQPSPTARRKGPPQTPPAPKGPPPSASQTPTTKPRPPIPPSGTPASPASPASPTAPRTPGATATSTARPRQSPPPPSDTPVVASPSPPAMPTPSHSPGPSGGSSATPMGTPHWPRPPSPSPPGPAGALARR